MRRWRFDAWRLNPHRPSPRQRRQRQRRHHPRGETHHESSVHARRFHTITPNVIVESAESAIKFYKLAFDAEVQVHLTMPDGSTAHCELLIGDSRLNLAEAMEGWPVQPLVAQLYVENSDEVFKRAVDAGATVLMPVTDMFFGQLLQRERGSWRSRAARAEVPLELAGLRQRGDELNARRDLAALLRIGVLSAVRARRLERLRELRRLLVHDATASAEQVHEAARIVANEFVPFYDAYRGWIARGFSADPPP